MVLTEIGRIAFNYWKSIPIHYPFVELYEFVIMPDHMHGIIQLSEKQHEGWKPNEFGLQAKNIPAIIRAYKASVKRYANENAIPFHWQPRYYDSVFKCQMQLYITNNYIRKNVEKWKLNK